MSLKNLIQEAILTTVINEGTPAKIGKRDGTVAYTDQNGTLHRDRCWVRIGSDGTETVARCTKASQVLNSPVLVAMRNNVLTVISVDDSQSSEWSGGYSTSVGNHSWQHLRRGADPLYMEGLMLLPLLAWPTTPLSMTVKVNTGFYYVNGVQVYFEETTSSSLSAYIPASPMFQHFIILCIDTGTNGLVVVDGVDVNGTVAFSDIEAIAIDETYLPLVAIRFYSAMTTIQLSDIIFDMRSWLHNSPPVFDINALTEQTAPTVNDDYLAIYDAGLTAHRKVLLKNVPGITGNVGSLFLQTADQTVANTTTETTLLGTGKGSKTIAANTLEVGDTIRINLAGHRTTTGTPDSTRRVKLGGTTLITRTATLTGLSADAFDIVVMITCRSIGATGTVVAYYLAHGSNDSNVSIIASTPITIDTTVNNTIDITVQWSVADASNTITSVIATIEKLAATGLA